MQALTRAEPSEAQLELQLRHFELKLSQPELKLRHFELQLSQFELNLTNRRLSLFKFELKLCDFELKPCDFELSVLPRAVSPFTSVPAMALPALPPLLSRASELGFEARLGGRMSELVLRDRPSQR